MCREPKKRNPSVWVRRTTSKDQLLYISLFSIFSNPVCDSSDDSRFGRDNQRIRHNRVRVADSSGCAKRALVLHTSAETTCYWFRLGRPSCRRGSRRVSRTNLRRAAWRPRDAKVPNMEIREQYTWVNFFVRRAHVGVTPLKFCKRLQYHSAVSIPLSVYYRRRSVHWHIIPCKIPWLV